MVAAVFYFYKAPAEVRAVRFTVAPPEKQAFPVIGNTPNFLSISPDGTKLAFVTVDSTAHRMLWIRDLDSQAAQSLPGTDDALAPFWSPDSRFIAFTAGNSLKKVAVTGGPAQTITALPANGGGTWNRSVCPPQVVRQLQSLHSTRPGSNLVMHGHSFYRAEGTFSTQLLARIRKIPASTLDRSIPKRRSSF